LYIFAFQLRGNEMHRREGLRTHQQVKERMRIQMAVRSSSPSESLQLYGNSYSHRAFMCKT